MAKFIGERRSPLQVLLDVVDERLARRVAIEAEIGRLKEAERLAVEEAAETPGESAYLRGRPAWKAREECRKLSQELEDIAVELEAMGRRRERLTADESAARLRDAIEYVVPLHVEMDDAVKEAAALVAQFVRGPWAKWRDALNEITAVARRGEGIAGEAMAVDPDARAKWAQAVSCPHEPVPANVASWFEAILLASLDPNGDISIAPRARHLAALVSDLRAEDVFAARGDLAAFVAGSSVGQILEQGLRASLSRPEPEPEPELSAEQIARNAVLAAENEARAQRAFDRLKPHERQMQPVPAAAGPHSWEILDEHPTVGHGNGGALEDGPLTAAEQAAIDRMSLDA